MNSKSNKSYKLRTKQMAIHIRAFGQIDKPVVTTKTEENLFTIDDLRSRRCAVINDYSITVLQAVLSFAFPNDLSSTSGSANYYYAQQNNNEYWVCYCKTDLPAQSAIKFFNQIKNNIK